MGEYERKLFFFKITFVHIEGPSDDTTKELKIEREKLAKARGKIREQETAINSSESKLKHALDNARQMEQLYKQKEATLEQKIRELAKLQKSHDMIKAKLDKRNDSVESRYMKRKTNKQIVIAL